MFQGTGSDVGKSVLVAGFCRALTRRGLRVKPFKPQNMSNNAAVTPCGGEIGRAQALQALACNVEASVDMNPVLLKPQSDNGAQVIVQGRMHSLGNSRYFQDKKPELLAKVIESFARLKKNTDIVVVEGAGSPAEVNLRNSDIANMGFALATKTPVILIGDIDRGGVIASIVGTHQVLETAERDLIKGYVINKFRGDVTLFDEALTTMTTMTHWPSYGVLPFISAVRQLPAEDAVDLDKAFSGHDKTILIAVPMLSRISNFDDLDPLISEPDIDVRFIKPGETLPVHADLVLIPGTKATLADLEFFRNQGWDIDLSAHIRRGGRVLGICGGYQMLGQKISDPQGIESSSKVQTGLHHLDVITVMRPSKHVKQTQATSPALGCTLSGYEIHIGETSGPDTARPFLLDEQGVGLGATSPNRQVTGVYLHGLFSDDIFRMKYLAQFRGGEHIAGRYLCQVEQALNTLADAMEVQLDMDAMLQIAQQENHQSLQIKGIL